MSIVGTKAITYQETLGIPFNKYWEYISTPPEGGAVRPEAFRGGTLMYLLFSTWKWKNTITMYTPRRQIKKVVILVVISFGMLIAICSLLALMHRVQGLHGGAHHQLGQLPGGQPPLDPRRDMHGRIPPVYNPETDRNYPFRNYVEDVGLWTMMTELPAHQMAPTLVARLQGEAREVASQIPTEQLVAGVILQDGSYVDPVSNLIAYLGQRFAAYPEEERNEAMLRVWHFARKPSEGVDSVVSRFRELRLRAAREGHYIMSVEGWSYIFL